MDPCIRRNKQSSFDFQLNSLEICELPSHLARANMLIQGGQKCQLQFCWTSYFVLP